ncbi:Tir chaperone protein (CesT) family protein [Paraburkholderia tuberum]|uniref:Tir chaperone protein (CesT) family protein n=2 Tax=Paraburkholderia tuberum TaxID=157910 RepID=A0A1H1KLW7_9BURK|nr:Tir chaperone protein (CesT) family protein [Paraburkholderia tuberum]
MVRWLGLALPIQLNEVSSVAYENYMKLLHDVCDLVGLDDVARLIDGGQLDISGHTVSIRYDESVDPLGAVADIDLGPVPEEDRETIYRHALEVNFHSAPAGNGTLSLDPQAERLQYSFRFPLDGTRTATDLFDTVTDLLDSLNDVDTFPCLGRR